MSNSVTKDIESVSRADALLWLLGHLLREILFKQKPFDDRPFLAFQIFTYANLIEYI